MSGKPDQASSKDFQLLGLDHSASPEQVKKAYKSFVKTWHPDRFPLGSHQQQQAEDRLKEINAAYRRIRNSWATHVFQQKPGRKSSEEPEFHEHSKGKARQTTAASYTSTSHPRQACEPILTLFRTVVARIRYQEMKSFHTWILVLFLLSLIAVLIKTNQFPFWDDHREQPRGQRVNVPPLATLAPAPPRAPEGAEPSEASSSTQTMPPPEFRDNGITRLESDPGSSGGSFYTIGSSQKEVLRIQGKPTKVYGQTWTYGLSDVTFKEGRVWRYHNFDGTLRVQMLPSVSVGKDYNPKTFSLGSSRNDVLLVQGTPTQVEPNKWSYGFSEVYFKNGLVSGYNNFFSNLKVLMLPSKASAATLSKGYFTIGSSQDDVLAVQGTPTVVHGNTWSYQLSEVQFGEGKVRIVNDFSGNLNFLSPDLVSSTQ
jgi:curved DNA-binding protein CbpA